MSALPDLSALSLNGKCRKCLPIPADVSTGIPDAAAEIIEREECEICLEPLGDDSPQGEWKQPGRKWAVQCVNQHLIHKQCLLGKIVRSAPSTQYNQADFDRFTGCSICAQPILDGVLRSVGVEIDRDNKTLDWNDVGLAQMTLIPDLPSIPGQNVPSNPNASPVANNDDDDDDDNDSGSNLVGFVPYPDAPGLYASWMPIVNYFGYDFESGERIRVYRTFSFDMLVLDDQNPRFDEEMDFLPDAFLYSSRMQTLVQPGRDETELINILYLFFNLKHIHTGDVIRLSTFQGNLMNGIEPSRLELLYRSSRSNRDRRRYMQPSSERLFPTWNDNLAFNPDHWGTFDAIFYKFRNTMAEAGYNNHFFEGEDEYVRNLGFIAPRWFEAAANLNIGAKTIADEIDNLITKGDDGGDGFLHEGQRQQSPYALLQYNNYYYPAVVLSHLEEAVSDMGPPNRMIEFASGRNVQLSFNRTTNVDVARAINRVLVLMKFMMKYQYLSHVDALVYRRIYMMVEALLYHAPFYLLTGVTGNDDYDKVTDNLVSLQWQIVVMLARGNLFLFYDENVITNLQNQREPDLVRLSDVIRTVENYYDAGNSISVRRNRFGQPMNFTGRFWWRSLPPADRFLGLGTKYDAPSFFDHQLMLDYAKAAKRAGFKIRNDDNTPYTGPPGSPGSPGYVPTSPQYDPTEPGYDPDFPQGNPGRARSPTSDDDDLNLPPLRRQRIEMLLAEERERKRLELISKLKMCD